VIRAAVDAWLEVSSDPEVRQLILLDAPAVIGWAGFRDVAQRYSLGMTEQMLNEAIRAGQLARQPVRPLAHVLIGALDEAAMVVAHRRRSEARPPRDPAGAASADRRDARRLAELRVMLTQVLQVLRGFLRGDIEETTHRWRLVGGAPRQCQRPVRKRSV